MARLRLFGPVRDAAGRGTDEVPGSTVAEVLSAARARYGEPFGLVLESCQVWVNGETAAASTVVGSGDEVALLPPVSGG